MLQDFDDALNHACTTVLTKEARKSTVYCKVCYHSTFPSRPRRQFKWRGLPSSTISIVLNYCTTQNRLESWVSLNTQIMCPKHVECQKRCLRTQTMLGKIPYINSPILWSANHRTACQQRTEYAVSYKYQPLEKRSPRRPHSHVDIWHS